MGVTAEDAAAEVIDALGRCRFTFATEADLHNGVAVALAKAGLLVEHERRLSATDRIDMVVDRVGIEVKIAGDWRDVARQLRRYCASDQIDAVVLVTTKAAHRRVRTAEMDGADVWVVDVNAPSL